MSPTLNAFDNAHETRATILVIDGTRVDDVRVYDDGLTPCLKNRMGTGGNNVPFVAQDNPEPVIAFDGYNQSVTENVYRALRIGIDSGDCIAIPIQDGREMEKKQNGMGIGDEGDPSYTLDQTGAQAVAYSIREDAKANNFSATEIQTARALQALQPSVQSHHAQTFIAEPTMQVRRLTPLECTRLMGWRDDHLDIGTLDAPDQDYARQIVRHLWRGLQPAEIQRATRGFLSVLTPEILLAAVRVGWISWDMAGECAARTRQVQGEDAWPKAFMRRLRTYQEHRPSPHRREPFEQLAEELGRPLPFLSFDAASDTKGLFYLGLYEQAQRTGFLQQALDSMAEMGRPFAHQERVAGISDTNRYKMCGNGVASPVAQWIGEAIMGCRPDAEPRSFMDHYLDQLEAERRSDAGM